MIYLKYKNEKINTIYNQKKLNVMFFGIDDWNRPVYKDKKGNLYKDVNLGERDRGIKLCTVFCNEFYGEPDIPLKDDIKINIVKNFKKEKENKEER